MFRLQTTITHECALQNPEWLSLVNGRKPEVLKFRHYRLVVGTVGYPLSHFRGSRELLHATYDVSQG